MKDIFENAKWGQKFKTVNRRRAIFLGQIPHSGFYALALEDNFCTSEYNPDGTIEVGWKRPKNGPHPLDIKIEPIKYEKVKER